MADRTEIKLTGADNVLDMLRALPRELVAKRGGPVSVALRKAAKLIQVEVKTNIRSVTSNQTTHAERTSTGLLLKSSRVARAKPPSGVNGERYTVGFAKNVQYVNGVSTQETARWLEYGTSKQMAEPFIRPAVQSKGEAAIQLAVSSLVADVDRIAQRLLKV